MRASELDEKSLLTSLLDASVDGILAFDRECRYTAWNGAMERISGLRKDEVLGRCAFDLFPFLKATGEDQYFFDALAGLSVVAHDRPYTITETGREGFFDGHYSPLYGPSREVVGGVAFIRDITARRRAEEGVRAAHQRLRFHVENTPLAVIEWDSDFRISRWTPAAERLFGWRADEVLGKRVTDWRFVFQEDAEAVARVTDRQRRGVEGLGVLRNRNYTKDGALLHCEWYNSVLHDESGGLVSVLSLVLDVTARVLAEEESAVLLAREQESRREAEAANRLKDEFIAIVSHELRTPLTSIIGYAIMLRESPSVGPEVAAGLEVIERNARAEARLVSDLLDLSGIITGKLRLNAQRVELPALVEAAVASAQPAAQAKAIRLRTDLAPGPGVVTGDPERLQQVVSNLLSNAIKFTHEGGRIEVNLVYAGPLAEIKVRDTGQGIRPDFLPYVFDRFRQGDGSTSRRHGGLGLGLALVRNLTELHGGAVRAESGGEGLGSTFTVELPLAAGHEDAPGSRGPEGSAGLGAHPAPLDGVRLLLVDDDDDFRELLRMMLTQRGATVTAVGSAAEALEELKRSRQDVLVSDVGMPGTDGYELLREVRALPEEQNGRIPAVALTGYAADRDRGLAASAGYQMHLPKPVDPAELTTALARLAGRGGPV